jgi:outer membrane receptor protein involved in Fe transport
VTGGRQLITGLYVQDVWRPHPAWELVGGVRADWWRSDDGFRRDTPPPAGVPPRQTFDDIDRLLVSPRVAALVHVTPTTDVRASVYRGFRVPTLNEQYRLFRVRNDVTTANPGLEPEILTGGELGAQQRWGPLEARVTGFWNEVQDLVANVTLTTPVADCPAGTTCRQRQNLELARIRGGRAGGAVSAATSSPTRVWWTRPSNPGSRATAWPRCPATRARSASASRTPRSSPPWCRRASSATSSRTT